jgi:HK97 family phage major capsid protein
VRNILEMKQKRAALVKQAREILDRADAEKRGLTAEETQTYDRIMAEVDALGVEIEREERLQALEARLSQVDQPVAARRDQPGVGRDVRLNLRAMPEYREAFWQALRAGHNSLTADQVRLLMDPEVRALAVGTDAAGGYLVPDEFERTLIQKLTEQNVMRSLATVITTGSGSREIPVEESYGSATWLGEGAAFTESDSSFSQVVLGAHKLGTIIKVSEELLNDSAFDIEAYVASAFARRFARAEEAAFVNGDGVGKPLGVVQSVTLGKVGAAGQTTSITADDLIDLYHALRRPYRQRATWLMADSTVKAVRKLKDNDGQYLWQPGLQAGRPDTILGRPVAVSDDVPAMAAGARSILFGDFSYYWIADRQGRVMQRLVELYAANGQVGFRMYARVDGKLTLPEAVVCYQNAAA